MHKSARPLSRHRPATLKDVARDLGLSVATVSRALAKPNLLRPATAARVREAVDRLGYRPNLAAHAAAGIPSGEESCVPGEFTVASGETAMASLLTRPKRPTAIFCANDE